MTYRSLLVHLDNDPLAAARSEAATRLARDLDCHLVGVAPTGMLELPAADPGASLSEYAVLAWDLLRDQAEHAAERFREACRTAGLKSFEAVVDEADKASSLVRHAHCSDLTVLSQAEQAAAGHRRAQELVEQVVLYSARPTLILPCAGKVANLFGNAMVAWDDSREATRALSDALPLLRRSRQVQVVSWNEDAGADSAALRPRLEALRQWLAWQGVAAEVGIESTEIAIGEAMLSRAADLDAELIVMGAYGHARWTEWVLGGATRGLLASMTVPVLMSH